MNNNESTQPLGGSYAWLVWVLAVTFVVYLFSIQTGYAIVNDKIREAVGLSSSQIATIAATYTWVFALCQFYGGALLDQLGAKKVLPLSIGLVTVGVFIFANANTFEMLLLGQAVLAIGSCTGFVGAGYIGGQWFGMAKFSLMFGFVQVVAAATSAFSQNLIDISLQSMDWRTLFNGVGIFGIVLCIVGAIFIKNREPVPPSTTSGPIDFLSVVTGKLIEVAKIPHIWISSMYGALTFGTLISLGVVWAPGLLRVRGADDGTAFLGASLLWLGLAVGSAIVPRWSDVIRQRKLPIIVGSFVQLTVFVILVYVADLGSTIDLILCFIFGFANAAHMLAFSTAADVVKPEQIGTSAAVVNGTMFILGGILISRPGMRVDHAIELGIEPKTMDLLQYAAQPLLIALAISLVLGFAIKETYPDKH